MKKSRLILLRFTLILALAFVAGCGSGDNKPQPPPPQAQMSMPMGDPMTMMKDMDKSLQDMTRQVRAGQMMDAQKSAAQIASLADKVTPHMNDAGMKDRMKTAAYDLRDTANGVKVDQTVLEGKMKTMQEVMDQATKNLQAGAHNH